MLKYLDAIREKCHILTPRYNKSDLVSAYDFVP